jgi:lipoprotein-anchoring transpeptidase ErfK/SrfK
MLTEMMCAMGMTVTLTGEPVICPKTETASASVAAVEQPARPLSPAEQRKQALERKANGSSARVETARLDTGRPTGDVAARLAVARANEPAAGKTRQIVPFASTQHAPGTIVVRNGERALYYVRGDGLAYRYRIAVGKQAHVWKGDQKVIDMQKSPAWSPPAIIRRAQPNLPDVIPGGAPNNPMGVAAIVLGDEYAIHGTNRPDTIGTAASYGCFRMHNEDILDLYGRVSLGTKVVALP